MAFNFTANTLKIKKDYNPFDTVTIPLSLWHINREFGSDIRYQVTSMMPDPLFENTNLVNVALAPYWCDDDLLRSYSVRYVLLKTTKELKLNLASEIIPLELDEDYCYPTDVKDLYPSDMVEILDRYEIVTRLEYNEVDNTTEITFRLAGVEGFLSYMRRKEVFNADHKLPLMITSDNEG